MAEEAAVEAFKVDVVQHIAHFCRELEPHLFLRVEVLRHGDFHVPSAGATDKTLDDSPRPGSLSTPPADALQTASEMLRWGLV